MTKATFFSAVEGATQLRRVADEIEKHGTRCGIVLQVEYPDCDSDCEQALADQFKDHRQ